MTVLDFRSGGYADPRDAYGAQDSDAQGAVWQGRSADWSDDDWQGSAAAGEPARLRDREGVLGQVARLTHYVGALVSVCLMISLAIWGYRLVVRDVSGVPVIRAVEGDARIAPDEPGGELTDRTGLAVNGVAAGAEPAPVEQVAIAPAPTALDGQDVAMGELGATAQTPTVTSDEAVADPASPAVAVTDAEATRRAEAEIAAQGVPAVAPSETDLVAASAAVTDASGLPTQDTAITAALVEAGAVAAVTTPTRPRPRPQRIAAANAAPAAVLAAAPAEAAPLDVAAIAPAEPVAAVAAVPEPAAEPAAEAAAAPAPAAVASGTPLVQIGAFDSGSLAESEWARVSGRYGDLFAGKAPVVQEHKANGRTFYRLRIAGFENRDAARKFCAALIEAGADCIPAVAK